MFLGLHLINSILPLWKLGLQAQRHARASENRNGRQKKSVPKDAEHLATPGV